MGLRHETAQRAVGRAPDPRQNRSRGPRPLRSFPGAARPRLGLHRNYVGAIERGEINPTFRILLRLQVGLTIPLSELFALYELRLEGAG